MADVADLRYAVDSALIADNITSMRRILHRVDAAGKEANLKLNAKKTKVLHVTSKFDRNTQDICVNKTPLENVDDFKYLGSIKSQDGSSTKDINARIGMAKNRMVQLNNIWKDHGIPISLKVKLLKCLVWPVLLYGCEAWSQRKTDNKKIESCEMWFYRRLLRVKWTDKRTNISILEELGTSRKLLNIITERKLKYIGHASRNQNTNLMTISFQGKLEANRNKGRPPTTLLSNITDACKLKIHDIARASKDRQYWRDFVRSCTASNSANGDGDR